MSLPVFDDDERAIFGFQGAPPFGDAEPDPAAQPVAWVDPLEVENRLTEFSGGEFDAWLEQRAPASGEPATPLARASAERRIVPVVRAAFGLPAFDPQSGAGATAAYCLWLCDRFFRWRDRKKTSGGRSPTGPPPTDSSCPAPSPSSATTASP